MSADPRLIDIAAAVGDGSGVDWSRAAHGSDARTARVIRQLHLVERIASLHASPPGAHDGPPAYPSPADGASSEDLLPPGATWGPLQVIRRIGRGTYGEVYAARDVRLDRPVALKLLRGREEGEAPPADVIEEARLLARVRHPNVVTVYGAERIEGRIGLWMELVEGRTLGEELDARGRFGVDELVPIGTALCGALSAVHDAGLLHRDVRAHNVLRSGDGRLLLADFGTSYDETREGAVQGVAGTPLYLAPELLAGEAASVASDVYGLGVLLYHLLTGAYPLNGRSTADLRDAALTGRRVPLRERRPDVPRPLAEVVERAMNPVPSRRYPSAKAFGAALADARRGRRRTFQVAAAAALLAVTVMLGLLWRPGSGGTPPRAVLVAAFANQTGDPRLDDVVQVAFARELMQSRAVAVVPPQRIADALRLMKREASASLDARTARELALRDGAIPLIATGRIDRLSSRYVLGVTIERAAGGSSVAQASVEVADIDALLDGVRVLAADVRRAVGDDRRQVETDAALARVTTGSLDALLEYTAGVALVDRRRWAAAELRLAAAVRHDPFFASALIMLAHCRRNQGRAAGDWMPVADQARQLAAGLPARERYFIEGSYHQMKGDLPRAIAAYEALIAEQPNDFWGQSNLALAYRQSGRFREDLELSRRLVLQRPNDRATLVNHGARLIVTGGGVAEAMTLAARASALEQPQGEAAPIDAAWLELLPVFAAWADGRVADAAALLDRVSDVVPVSEWHAFGRGQMNLTLGRVDAAEHAFQLLPNPAERDLLLGYAALARGDMTGARAQLARAAPAWAGWLRGNGPVRVITPCWALLRAGLPDDCGRALAPWPDERPGWLVGELAAAAGDDDSAMRALQHLMASAPPGDNQYGMAADAVARQFEGRGDIPAAVDMLRRLDGVHRMVYPRSGVHGFAWLVARAHLVDLERRLGRADRVAALVKELEGWVAVADPDFVVRAALR